MPVIRSVPGPTAAATPPAPLGGPQAAFRPVPFWSWNEAVRPAEITDQIAHIKAGGWGGAFVHARVGLTVPYLGEDWFKAVDATLDACRKADLKVWLYDEDTWPSGFSGGSVPRAGVRHRMKALVARPVGTPPPPHCEPIGDAAHGLQVYVWTAPLANPYFYGSCYADLLDPTTCELFLNDAYRSYQRRYGQHYGNLITAEFTDEPSPLFRLGLPRGAVAWSHTLPAAYEQRFGEDLTPLLPLLFADTGPAAAFRVRFHRLVNDLFEENYTARLGRFCREHGIAFTGHFMSEHSLYDQLLWGSNVMPHYRHQDIPGIDHLARQVHEVVAAKQCQSVVNQYGKSRMLTELYGVSGQGMSFADRWWIGCQQIAIGANLLNPHLALYTLAGCRKRDYPPNLFYQQPWWPMNAVLDDALSRLCQVMSGGRYAADTLVIHPLESAAALWRGETDLAGDAATREDVHDHRATAAGVKAAIDAIDSAFKSIVQTLLSAQRQFDLGDETILADDATIDRDVAGPFVAIGPMRYRVVVVPPMATIRPTTLALLERYLAAGGVVILTGGAAPSLDGEPSSRPADALAAARQVDPANLVNTLADVASPSVRLHARGTVAARTFAHERHLDDGTRLVMLTNLLRARGEDDASVELTGRWSVDVYDALTDRWTVSQASVRGNITHANLSFAPTQTHVLRLSPLVGATPASPAGRRLSTAGDTGFAPTTTTVVDWRVERLDDNSLTLDTAAWREGNGEWSPRPLPVLAIQQRLTAMAYAGPLTLRFDLGVDAATAGRRVRLVVEYPERYTITVNGCPVEAAGLPYWLDVRFTPIDITPHLRPGENVIELHCPDYRPAQRATPDDPPARYGTEPEAIYLVGDFAVADAVRDAVADCPNWHRFGLPPVRTMRLDTAGPLTIAAPQPLAAGDVTAQGLPFYAGRVRYSASLAHSPRPRRLRIERLDAAVAEVTFDGQPVGHFLTHPLAVTLPPGGGELAITLYGTLRNLLGPHHHPEGETPIVSPPMFEPVFPQPVADSVLAWARNELSPQQWVDGYCLTAFGDLGRVEISEVPA